MLALTPFHETLLACLVPGVLCGSLFAVWGGRSGRLAYALLLLFLGVGVVWAALLAGVGYGYQAWQSAPEAPAEAFSDGGPMLGALALGWLPSSVACGLVFLVARRAARAARDEDDDGAQRRGETRVAPPGSTG